jgi:aryl-alcohol dehydrogenase-like predicted oxidoreductase
METRRFGRTGHMSTVAIFGAAALYQADQAEADSAMQMIIDAGVNHIDVANSYGLAEELLGPWIPKVRDQFFLGTKTEERTAEGARKHIERSLKLLRTDHVDLWQIHAVTKFEELDRATGPGGALETFVKAREEGLTRFIGITGHGMDAPAIYLEALRRFDFDSVLFPINPLLFADPDYRRNAEELIRTCQAKDVGLMIIKSIAKEKWTEHNRTHNTWYKPFTDPQKIQDRVNFVLSLPVTGICSAGDTRVLPFVLEACQNYRKLNQDEMEAMIARSGEMENIFT